MQEYQINNNLNIASTIDTVTNTTLNNWGPYILNSSVDKKFSKKLLEEGNKISEQYGVKKNLASRISRVRKFNDELWISEGLIPYVNEWLEGWNNFSRKSFYPKDANLSSVWINYQEAGEHNPEHIHSSADLSFVIFLKIPKEIEIEFNNFHVIKDHAFYPPGSIFFNYGEYHRLAVGGRYLCPKENSILMWPGYLRHGVTPFDFMGTRISVAGNISFLD